MQTCVTTAFPGRDIVQLNVDAIAAGEGGFTVPLSKSHILPPDNRRV